MKRVPAVLALALLGLVAAACGPAAPSGPAPSVDANAVHISADQLKFDTTTLTAPADKPFQIAFDNRETAPHNVVIFKDEARTQKVFGEAPSSGPKLVVYSVPALAAGTYHFVCEVHLDMKGTLTAG